MYSNDRNQTYLSGVVPAASDKRATVSTENTKNFARFAFTHNNFYPGSKNQFNIKQESLAEPQQQPQ